MLMNNMFYISLFLVGVFVSAVSQIILKKSANKTHGSIIKEYLNPHVIIAYVFFVSASFLAVTAYRYIPLSLGAILETSGYVYVTIMSYFFLKERITVKKALGMIIIIVGIVVFSLA